MNPINEPWTDTEDDFILDTYPRREWTIKAIAEKLERTPSAIRCRAVVLRVQRPKKLDYDAIENMHDSGLKIAEIARQLKCTGPAVAYAIKKMRGAV